MFNIKTIVIIIVVNVVKAEREHKRTNSEERTEPHILTAANNQPTDRRSSAETSLSSLDDYESIEYDEIGNEHTRRFVDNKNDEERNANSEENYDENEDMSAIPTKRKMLNHHMLVDTKGRSAAEDADEEDLKMAPRGTTNLNVPSINNHRPRNGRCNTCRSTSSHTRSGFVNPYYAMMPSSGLLQPLYTVNQPLLQTNQELSPPIIKPAIYEEKKILPFVNTNAYPYQTPLTEMVNPNYQQGTNLDILKKLIDATNSALTASGPITTLAQNYPQHLNPGGRFRRSTEIKINPFVSIVLPKAHLNEIPGMVNWGKINNFCC